MKNLKLTFLTILVITVLLLPITVLATNENIEILQKNEGDAIIYVNGHLDAEFEFAFSNDLEADKTTLNFRVAETDATENGNYIAYINTEIQEDYFKDETKKVYFWAKDSSGEFFAEAVEIDMDKAIIEQDISYIDSLTKMINLTITTETTETTENDVKITTTLGKIELEEGKYLYQLIKPTTEEYKNLVTYLERMSKINSVDAYTELKTYNEFANLFEKLLNELDGEKWENPTDKNEIFQPEDAKTGDQYVLWIMDSEKQIIDIQLLTSIREESQEKIVERVTTKLPVTYDNNVLLIVLGILVIVAIIVAVRINSLNKKQEK